MAFQIKVRKLVAEKMDKEQKALEQLLGEHQEHSMSLK